MVLQISGNSNIYLQFIFSLDPKKDQRSKKMFNILKPYCEISLEKQYRESSADKIALYKEALSTLSRMYFEISDDENRAFIIQVLNKNLKSSVPEVSHLAYSCINTIHSVAKRHLKVTYFLYILF